MNKLLSLAPLLLLLVIGCGKKPGTVNTRGASDLLVSKDVPDIKVLQSFQKAVEDNDLQTLQHMLLLYPTLDINREFDDGNTPIISAIIHDSISVRNFLIERGADLDRSSIDQITPLMMAVKVQDLGVVRLLIEKRVKLDKQDSKGETALLQAIRLQGNKTFNPEKRKTYEDIAVLLIKAGTNTELVNRSNMNALDLLQEYPNQKIGQLLRTILHVKLGTPDVATFKDVLVSGDVSDLNSMIAKFDNILTTYADLNPLVLALENSDPVTSLQIVQILLSNKVGINGPKEAETTPLIKSVLRKDLAFTLLFLQNKADVNLLDNEGKSALYHAIELLEPEIVQVLVNNEALLYYRNYGNGLSFSACKFARRINKGLSFSADKDKMVRILRSLDCRGSW